MKFRKVTASKYIGQDGLSLRELRDGSFSIIKDNTVTKWGCNFQTVRAAENFLNTHDYLHASAESIPMNNEDVDLIYDMYCIDGDPEFGNKWYISDNFWIQGDECTSATDEYLIQFKCSDGTCYSDGNEIVEKLDIITNDIFSSRILDKKEVDYIIAKSTVLAKRSAPRRPIAKPGKKPTGSQGGLSPKDLTRVRSSNVWAIGYEVNNSNHKIGDVYVQFKGKNGGPEDVYKYYEVPNTVYRKMITSPSKGAFIWKYLRNNFSYSKLTGDKRGKLPNAVN